ncbi:hypothetical protein ACLOJK_037351 [Asimina triloba]
MKLLDLAIPNLPVCPALWSGSFASITNLKLLIFGMGLLESAQWLRMQSDGGRTAMAALLESWLESEMKTLLVGWNSVWIVDDPGLLSVGVCCSGRDGDAMDCCLMVWGR